MKVTKDSHIITLCPKTRGELEEIIYNRINEVWASKDHNIIKDQNTIKDQNIIVDLNDIDVSNIRNFSHLFTNILQISNGRHVLNFALDKWDMSNAVDVSYMFNDMSVFKCDISGWNVSSVYYCDRHIFEGCTKMWESGLGMKCLQEWRKINKWHNTLLFHNLMKKQ